MNSVFSTTDFWKWYFTLEPRQVSQDDLAAQLNAFRPDFPVHEETLRYEGAGRRHSAIRRFVEFPFYCGDGHSIVVEYKPDIDGCTIDLFLHDTRSKTKSQMGWWDLARWHPYCLRLDELDCLATFWSQRDRTWDNLDLPWLLLCPFVGLPDSETRDVLAARVEESLKSLGIARDDQFEVPLYVPDGDYRWENDPDLGWVFTSEEYCCYSLRNEGHAASGEGRFPFEAFAEMMAEVRTEIHP